MPSYSNQPPECLHPLVYSVAGAAKTASLGRTTLYKLIAEKRLPVIKIGNRTLIRHDALVALLEAPPANDNSGDLPRGETARTKNASDPEAIPFYEPGMIRS